MADVEAIERVLPECRFRTEAVDNPGSAESVERHDAVEKPPPPPLLHALIEDEELDDAALDEFLATARTLTEQWRPDAQ